MQGGSLNATACEFKENNSADLGGAVYLSAYEGVLIDRCSFLHNSANGNTGDDIFATGTSNTLEIRHTKFVSPDAVLSVELQSVHLKAEGVRFDNIFNRKSAQGAAISCSNCARI